MAGPESNTAWLLLTGAILCEVLGTSLFRASEGFSRAALAVGALAAYGLSFFLLSHTLKSLPLGQSYAIWAGGGTALTALVGVLCWHETLGPGQIAALGLIVAGVVLLNLLGGGH